MLSGKPFGTSKRKKTVTLPFLRMCLLCTRPNPAFAGVHKSCPMPAGLARTSKKQKKNHVFDRDDCVIETKIPQGSISLSDGGFFRTRNRGPFFARGAGKMADGSAASRRDSSRCPCRESRSRQPGFPASDIHFSRTPIPWLLHSGGPSLPTTIHQPDFHIRTSISQFAVDYYVLLRMIPSKAPSESH